MRLNTPLSSSISKMVLAIVLSVSLLATGCSSQWISVALADLPVLTAMTLNIGTLITTLESGKQLSSAEATAIQNISAQASRDLNLLAALYNDYKANPNVNTIQKIKSVITDINQNLPSLLQSAHINDPILSARVTAGVNLILTTVASFAALIPQTPTMPTAQKRTGQNLPVPQASELKKQWNQQVCGAGGGEALSSAFSSCAVR